MKKLLCIILATLMLLSLFACGKTEVENSDEIANNGEAVEDVVGEAPAEEEESPAEEPSETPETPAEEENAPAAKPEEKPADKPASTPEVKPEEKPAAKPEETPAPEVEPEVEQKPESTGKTTGDVMLSIFRANKDKSIEDIANACLADPSIQFMSGTIPVEAGFLAEFGGDITGFDKGVKFGPMMGSIAFSGFVFEVSGDANAFAKDLASKANPRWNICVEADQTVWEVSGNKVFFLMCPSTLGE